MKLPTILLAVPLAAGLVLPRGSPKALYFLDNSPSGASVVSLKVKDDGTLSDPSRTPTGGKGLIGLTANGPVMTDSLFTQDAVVVSGSRLSTVSPGSNTISLFNIPANDPLHPELVGHPVTTGGEFPSAVAFSHSLHLACVLNGGSIAGVACYKVTNSGLERAGSFMPLPLTQTTPPVGPPGTGSDIVFNPSSTALFVTLKGDGSNPGYIFAFPIVSKQISSKPVISRPPELLLDFSLNFFDIDTKGIITDPAYGASIVSVASNFSVTVDKRVAIPGQGATCWSAYSSRFDAVFIFDGGKPNITTLDPKTGDVKYTITGAVGRGGSFDSVVSGEFLYVLQGAAGISVFSLLGSVGNGKTPKLVQSLDLSGLGSRQGWQGLAVYG